jgi:predicted enzyme related to lactoylglutathione lyase
MNGGIVALGEERAGMPSHWAVYVAVEDPDATCQKATELGGQVFVPPMDIAQGRFGVLGDPQGAAITVMRVDDPD